MPAIEGSYFSLKSVHGSWIEVRSLEVLNIQPLVMVPPPTNLQRAAGLSTDHPRGRPTMARPPGSARSSPRSLSPHRAIGKTPPRGASPRRPTMGQLHPMPIVISSTNESKNTISYTPSTPKILKGGGSLVVMLIRGRCSSLRSCPRRDARYVTPWIPSLRPRRPRGRHQRLSSMERWVNLKMMKAMLTRMTLSASLG